MQTLSRVGWLRISDAAIKSSLPRTICLSLPDGEVLSERYRLIIRTVWPEFPGSRGVTEITRARSIGKDWFPVQEPFTHRALAPKLFPIHRTGLKDYSVVSQEFEERVTRVFRSRCSGEGSFRGNDLKPVR